MGAVVAAHAVGSQEERVLAKIATTDPQSARARDVREWLLNGDAYAMRISAAR